MHATTLWLPAVSLTLLLALAGAGAAGEPATTRAVDPVEAMCWQRRVVIVFASAEADQKLARQRELFARESAGFAERRVAIVEVVGDAVTVDGKPTPVDASALAQLRERFEGWPEGFRVVLVGLDGGEKLRRDEAVWPQLLFETIDAMPMRQAETRPSGR